jgi:polyisoprenoid-binding protein YceI
MARLRIRGWKGWLAIGVTAVAIAVVGGPFVYIHFIEGKAPPPLTLASSSPTVSAAGDASAVDGTWKAGSGSTVGYRVKEVLFGQSNVAAGRTSSITGSLTLSGTTITAASFEVDMATVASDQMRRDNQFKGRIMDVATFPTATFKLTRPIALGSLPAEGVTGTFEATGDLTLRGTTRSVTFRITGRRTGATVQISGSIPITFSGWNIPNPSFGPVSTEDHGTLEFLLTFRHA